MSFSLRVLSLILAFMLPSMAFAAGGPAGPGGGAVGQLIFFGGFVLIFYFLMWRPQSKRTKEHRDLLAGLSKGDEVMVSGGLLGKIVRIKDDYLAIEISEGVEVKVQKAAVSAALPKGTLKDI
jgi:preprotein translocase subunit YajC